MHRIQPSIERIQLSTRQQEAGMTFGTIGHEVSGRILTLTLNRPQRRNAFTGTKATGLIRPGQANEDDGISAIVVTGTGKAFCDSMDLSAGDNDFGLEENLRPTLQDRQ